MGERIPVTEFCVSAVHERDRFDIWRDSISCIFSVEPDETTFQAGFEANLKGYMCGQVLLVHTQSRQQSWNHTGFEIGRDRMDHYMFQIFDEGEMLFEHEDERYRVGQKQIVIFDLSRDVSTLTNQFTNWSIVIPRDMIEPQLLHPDGHHMRIFNLDDPMAMLFYEHMLSLKSIADTMSMSQAAQINPATVALAAAMMNGSPTQGGQTGSNPTLAQSIMVKRAIENSLSDSDLTPESLSRTVGMSRSKLYSIFEREGGVAAYLRERRLRKAMTMLMRPENSSGSILEIAYALGYRDNSAFSRAFKNRYGTTPRDIRQSQNFANYEEGTGNQLDRRYEDWLRDLC